MAIELTQEISRHITSVTEETRETTFLLQRLSMALQRENAVSFQHTLISDRNAVSTIWTLLTFNIHAYRFCADGQRNNNNNKCKNVLAMHNLNFIFWRNDSLECIRCDAKHCNNWQCSNKIRRVSPTVTQYTSCHCACIVCATMAFIGMDKNKQWNQSSKSILDSH